MTVLELFLETIKAVYENLLEEEEIPRPSPEKVQAEEDIYNTLTTKGFSGHFLSVIKYNLIVHDNLRKPQYDWLWDEIRMVQEKNASDDDTFLEGADPGIQTEIKLKNGKVKQLTDKDDMKKYQTLIKSLRTKDSCQDLFSQLPVVLGLVEGEEVDFAR